MAWNFFSAKSRRNTHAKRNLNRAFRPRLDALEDRLAPAVRTWTGAGADTLWSTPANWGGTVPVNGDELVFSSTGARTFNTNDLLAMSFHSLTFQGTVTYNITGNAVTLSTTGNAINSTGNNTVDIPILTGANQTYLSNSGTLTIKEGIDTGTRTITFGGAGNTVVQLEPIVGTGALTKTGTGTLTLSTTNTYPGATTISGGTLVAAANGALGTSAAGTTVNGGSLGFAGNIAYTTAEAVSVGGVGAHTGGAFVNVSGTNSFAGNVTMTAATTLGSAGGAMTLDGNLANGGFLVSVIGTSPFTLDGVLSGAGGLAKSGSGILTLNNTNTYAGATTVSGGSVVVTANGALGTAANGTTIATGSALIFDGGFNYTTLEAVTINGIGSGGAGALRNLSGDNVFDGSITMASASTIGSVADTLELNGNINNGGFLLTFNGAGTVHVDGDISGAGGLTKSGSGTLLLHSNSNTYGGATSIQSGLVQIEVDTNALPNASAVTVNTGAVLDLNDDFEVIGSLSGAGTVDVGSGQLSTGGNNTNTTFSGVIEGTGSLTKAGTGTFTLTGVNTYSGATNVNAGILVAGENGALGTTAAGTTVASGASLGFTGSTAYALAEAVTLNGTGSGNKGALHNVSGNNTFTGAITLGSASTIGAPGGTLGLSGNVNAGGFALTVNSVGTLTLSGVVSNASSVVKTGTGTVVFSNTNTYHGATNVNTGSLIVSANGALGSTTGGTTVASGATLGFQGNVNYSNTEAVSINGMGASAGGALRNVNGANSFAGAVTLAGKSTMTSNAGSLVLGGNVTNGGFLVTVAGTGDLRVNGGILGAGGLTKQGTGTLDLAGPNTYSGVTTIQGGMLRTQAGTSLSSSSSLSVSDGATFDLNDLSQSIGSLAGGGTVDLGTATLTAGANNATTLFNGTILGTGGLTKVGTGTMTLSGANTYTGATLINAGTVAVTVNDALGTADAGTTVASGAMLQFQNNVNYASTEAVSIIGTGVGGKGALHNLNFNSHFAGNVTLAGPATIGSSTGQLTLAGNVNNNGHLLTLNGLGKGEISGVLSGTGGLTKLGTGMFTLSNDNTYDGATTINAGTLIVSENGALGGTAQGTDVNAGGTLAFSGDVDYFDLEAVTLSGIGASSAGALRNLDGENFFSGPITLELESTFTSSAGGLVLDGPINNNNFLPTFNTTGWIEVDGVISGGKGLTKTGTGDLVLNNTNTYVGVTNVNSGLLVVTENGALGGVAGNTVVKSGASLGLWGDVDYTTLEPVKISGTGISGSGAFQNLGGNNEWHGPVSLGTAASIASHLGSMTLNGQLNNASYLLTVAGSSNVTIDGVIKGTGGLTKAGTGAAILNGVNTYTGATKVTAGTLGGSGPVAGMSMTGGSIRPGSDSSKDVFKSKTANLSTGGNLTLRVSDYGTAGVDFDRLNVTNAFTLGGTSTLTLDLSGLNSTGTVTGAVLFGSVTGSFSSINIINNPNTYTVNLVFTASGMNIVIS